MGFVALLGAILVPPAAGAAPASGQATATTARSAELKTPLIPNYFDPRERIPYTDVSKLPRLRLLTTTDFPPFSFLDPDNRLAGFNVDLARSICAEIGLQAVCDIQALPWDELDRAMADGAGDALIAGLAITPDNRLRYAFSRPYLQFPARFARNRAASFTGDAAAALSGRKVGVVAGSAHARMLEAYFPKMTAVPYPDEAALFGALKSGAVDAVFADGLRLSFWLSSAPAAGCCAFFNGPYLSEAYLGEGMAVATRRGDSRGLGPAIDHALLVLARKGRLGELYLRYFPNGMY